jgi:hypothetical protein
MRLIIVLFFLLLVGCSNMPMERVMRECDTGQSFNAYASCIKQKYDAEGNHPKAASVRAFYAILAEIKEANSLGNMTDAQAKSALYKALLATIEADNKSEGRNTVCRVIGNTIICN